MIWKATWITSPSIVPQSHSKTSDVTQWFVLCFHKLPCWWYASCKLSVSLHFSACLRGQVPQPSARSLGCTDAIVYSHSQSNSHANNITPQMLLSHKKFATQTFSDLCAASRGHVTALSRILTSLDYMLKNIARPSPTAPDRAELFETWKMSEDG